MAGDFLPAAGLLHPDGGEAEMLDFAGVGHFATPGYGFASGEDYGVAVDAGVFDLAVVGSDYQEAGFDHAEDLLFVYEFIQRIGDYEIVGPEGG